MHLPITRPTPLECLLWAGAGLLWLVAGGLPGVALPGFARREAGVVQVDASPICRANDPGRHRGEAAPWRFDRAMPGQATP